MRGRPRFRGGSRRSRDEPPDRRMMDVVAPGDAAEALALVVPAPGFLLLVGGQLVGAAHLAALRLGSGPSLACPRPDQLALELGQARQHRQHEPAVRRGGVGPWVAQAAEHGALLGQGAQHVEEVPRAPRQPVQPRDHHHVAVLDVLEELGELRPVRLRPRSRLAEHAHGPCRVELLDLGRERLAVRAHPRVAQQPTARHDARNGDNTGLRQGYFRAGHKRGLTPCGGWVQRVVNKSQMTHNSSPVPKAIDPQPDGCSQRIIHLIKPNKLALRLAPTSSRHQPQATSHMLTLMLCLGLW